MIHKCRACKEDLDKITLSDGPTTGMAWLNFPGDAEERAELYACTSGDCKEWGRVIVIPLEAKEE